jgi:hypothetical protein
MNKGRRLVRNTLFGTFGAVVLLVAANRLYAEVVRDDAPDWLAGVLSLGLKRSVEPEAGPVLTVADARDFRRVVVVGRFSVEIVGAPEYKVTATLADGSPAPLHVGLGDDAVHLHGINATSFDTGAVDSIATLRIETPVLERVHARVAQLDISGIGGDDVQVSGLGEDMVVRLRQNAVAHWRLYSGAPIEVRVDDATFAAGTLNSSGNVVIRREP